MAFKEEDKRLVWNKGTVVPGNDSKLYRKDQCGAWMAWNKYGSRDSDFGWEIDHITPDSKGGKTLLSNLRPLQWQNNLSKSDGRLVCVVTADGTKNAEK